MAAVATSTTGQGTDRMAIDDVCGQNNRTGMLAVMTAPQTALLTDKKMLLKWMVTGSFDRGMPHLFFTNQMCLVDSCTTIKAF